LSRGAHASTTGRCPFSGAPPWRAAKSGHAQIPRIAPSIEPVVNRLRDGSTAVVTDERHRTRALAAPLVFTAGFLAVALLIPCDRTRRCCERFCRLGGADCLECPAPGIGTSRGPRTLTLEIVLRKQHYLQACAQGSVLLYWGWYWRPVYDVAFLIVAQLLFAYAFDMLLGWSRRDTYTLGFGPFPVIFSINLFLWFKPDWFYLQLLMVALGFAAKELIC